MGAPWRADIEGSLPVNVLPDKYHWVDDRAVPHFVQEGYALYKDVIDSVLIAETRNYMMEKYEHLKRLCTKGMFDEDVQGWSIAIARAYECSRLYEELIHSPRLVAVLKRFVGPDVAWMGHDAIFINVPHDRDPVATKGIHVDAWAGTGMTSVFVTTFITDVDDRNSLSICPKSHLQGMLPVKNRVLDSEMDFDSMDLNMIGAGDVMIWHPLLLHYTTGHSPDKIRILMTSRVTSTETPFTSQERALGYRTVSVGPLNQVLRLVGNDYLTPFRTHGGYVGVDRRMSDLYDHSPYQKNISYDEYL